MKLFSKTIFLMMAIVLSMSNNSYAGSAFGSAEDILFANKLWSVMSANKLVGKQAKPLKPFFGGAKPHGMILELAYQNLILGNNSGFIVVKRNYDKDGATVESVSKNRLKYLSSITVMYQRETGYDPENLNWFWAKYTPDGTLFTKGTTPLAGKVAKGKSREETKGCLFCHSSAGGGDYIFYPQIKLPGHKYGR
ncbi:MAG: hypothetical protein OQK35_00190 [Alphaproteobacteria bacterium]|nr:hypothetical protein [Rhodospirillales bacterium]MCW9044728.1 hypothetical protein [Alphaproteobacteria bacterium]